MRRRTSCQLRVVVLPASRASHRRSISTAHASSTSSRLSLLSASRLAISRVAISALSSSGSFKASCSTLSAVELMTGSYQQEPKQPSGAPNKAMEGGAKKTRASSPRRWAGKAQMTLRHSSVLGLALVIASCAGRAQPVRVPSVGAEIASSSDWNESAEELRVYESIFQSWAGSSERIVNAKVDPFVLDRPEAERLKTETRALFAGSAPDHPLDESAIDNWIAKQSWGDLFVTRFASGRKGWTVVDPKTLDQLHSKEAEGFWKRFHAKFPGESAIVSCLRVGFSSDRIQALVSVGSHYGDKGGWWGWYLLTRKDGQWVVTERVAVIVS